MNMEIAAHSYTSEKAENIAVRNIENITNCWLIFMLFTPLCIYIHPVTINSLAKLVSLKPQLHVSSFYTRVGTLIVATIYLQLIKN